jgi:aminopeptidase C
MKTLFALLTFLLPASLTATTGTDTTVYDFIVVKELKITPVKDQGRSGTCWSFSGLGMLEAELLRMGKEEVDLSEMFVVYTNYADKAKKYVRLHGDGIFSGGGSFADVLYTMKHYGVVPEEAMRGLEYGEDTHSHGKLDTLAKAYVDSIVKNPDGKLSPAWEKGFRGILNAYLGETPASFTYKEKTYTPQSFAASLGLNADDYVALTSFTHHPFYTEFAIEIPDNWRWATSYNLPLDEFMQVFDNAINSGYTIAWDSDVSEKGFTRNGIANVAEVTITQDMRQAAFDNYETTDDHGMLIYGIANGQYGTKYYMVKNSWGETGKYKGHWYASEAFVKYKTINIVVHKNALPAAIKAKLGLK